MGGGGVRAGTHVYNEATPALSFGIFMVTKWGASQYRILLKRRK